MSDLITDWLLGEDNLTIKYRTQTEILGQSADKAAALDWLRAFCLLTGRQKPAYGFGITLRLLPTECRLSYTD
jgi:hypothetical protein